MTQMTSAEYVKAHGGKCPACGSRQIEGGFIEVNGPTAHQPVNCMDCEFEWTDIYKLVGYEE